MHGWLTETERFAPSLTALAFTPTHGYARRMPGPADKPEASAGRWEAAGERRVRVWLPPAGEPDELEIMSIEPDRLKLRQAGRGVSPGADGG